MSEAMTQIGTDMTQNTNLDSNTMLADDDTLGLLDTAETGEVGLVKTLPTRPYDL